MELFEASRTSLILLENINIGNENELFDVFMDASLDEEKIRLIIKKLQRYLKTQCSWEKFLISILGAIYKCIKKVGHANQSPFHWILVVIQEHSSFLSSEDCCRLIVDEIYQMASSLQETGSSLRQKLDAEIRKMISRDIISKCILQRVANETISGNNRTDMLTNEKERLPMMIQNNSFLFALSSRIQSNDIYSQRKDCNPDENRSSYMTESSRIDSTLVKENGTDKKIMDWYKDETDQTKVDARHNLKRKDQFDSFIRPFHGSKLTIEKFVIFTAKNHKM